MISKRVKHGKSESSSQKELQDLRIMYDLIATREDLQELYECEMNEFVSGITLLAIKAIIDAEIESKCGKAHERSPEYGYYRHGKQSTGYVIVNGQKQRLEKPRVVTKGKQKKEEPLETYRKFQRNAVMEASVLAKMLHGVSTRDYRAAAEAIQEAYGIEKSSVSRHYVRASAKILEKFNERPIDRYFPIIFIDGYEIGGDIMSVALGIDEKGEKMVLSMRQGGTENEGVIRALFDDMERRGLHKDRPILFVIDGSKAIHAAITKRFEKYFIQRCREHKKRNILDHAPVAMKDEVERRIDEAYAERDYEKARSLMDSLAQWAEKINPDMAGSVREGTEETLTVIRLDVSPLLYKTVYSTNPIESLNSTFERFARRVKKWGAGDMKKRWLAAAILKAEERMHRVRGSLGIIALVKNMETIVDEDRKMLDRRAS
jgi:putative transposase